MKAYTDIEQSKKLAKILLLESSDHHYVRKVCDFRGNSVDGEWSCPKYGNINSKYANYIVQNFTSYEIIPCWSLTALLELLPNEILPDKASINDEKYYLVFKKNTVEYKGPATWDGQKSISSEASNLIDACYEMILNLHERKII